VELKTTERPSSKTIWELAAQTGTEGEKRAVDWLKDNGFKDIKKNKPTGCWDIAARKGKEKWIIEVKSGEHPSIDLANFEKMVDQLGNNIGLALVTEEYVHLLEYPKRRLAAVRAWKTRRSKKLIHGKPININASQV